MKKKVFVSLLLVFLISVVGCSNDNVVQNSSDPKDYRITSSQNENNDALNSELLSSSVVEKVTQESSTIDTFAPANSPIRQIDLLQKEFTLNNNKKVYGENFNVKSTLTDDDSIVFFTELISYINHTDAQSNDWPKYNPARAKEYAIKIYFVDGTINIINLHYTEQSNAWYISLFKHNEDKEYNSLVKSDGADKSFSKYTIENDKGTRLINFFK